MTTYVKLKFYNGKFTPISEATCLLTISVGQLNHEAERLKSTFRAINKNFKKCHILVCDTLQRHNIELLKGFLPDESIKIARLEGEQWFARNKKFFDELTIQTTYSRWDDWLQHERYYESYSMMLEEYNNDTLFKRHMKSTISEFYFRKKQNFSTIAFEKIYQSSLNYLLEECAVQKIISSFNFDYELYPSKRNAILSYCHKKFILNDFSPKLIPVSLKFISKKIAV